MGKNLGATQVLHACCRGATQVLHRCFPGATYLRARWLHVGCGSEAFGLHFGGVAEVALGLCLGRVSQEVGGSPAVCRRLQSGLPPGRTYLPHCQGRCVADKEHQVIGFWLAVMQETPFARTASRQSVQANAHISRIQPAAISVTVVRDKSLPAWSSSWCLLGSLSVACVVIIMG